MEFSQKFVNLTIKMREKSFVKVVRQTLAMLFPFAALGSIASVINDSILSSEGFIGNIFYIANWLPHIARIRSMFSAFSMLTIQIIAVLAAYQAAVYTAKIYHKNSELTGMTGMLAFLIIALRPAQQQYGLQTLLKFNVNTRLLGIQGLFVGIFVGFITGQIFRIICKKKITDDTDVFEKAYQTVAPVLVALTIAILINQIIIQLYHYEIPDAISDYYQNLSTKKHDLLTTLIVGAWSSLMAWFGLSGPYNNQINYDSNPATVANATFALKNHDVWNVPYKYTATTLYHSFGTFGGVGSTLALVIAIILVSRTEHYHRVARWSAFPVLFNTNQSILLGIPVLFNPIYLIPFVCTPVINMLIAALAIHLKIMPPVTYPVPLATPGVLNAFIGTGGNFIALFIGILVLAIDVIIYIPFVKFSDRIKVELEVQSLKTKTKLMK
ncbi:PTS transporter subunit EIIC [Ligilactobacillus cholophilus]|uniref:PTS transporter subunit EIIC n=1 Tax=Ligilactobacillus cholophilus TaxID=3050131 RepID=UPI0025B00DFA|nr:PTS transporter subunit EIIC [Ligilactobacillus cholophilus]